MSKTDHNDDTTFEFIIALEKYDEFWSFLKSCPGVKRVEVEDLPSSKFRYMWRVVTDSKGIYIPAFTHDFFRVLFDNGWKYSSNTQEKNINSFNCVGQECFNKLIIPPETSANNQYLH